MAYRLVYTKRAVKDTNSFDPVVLKRIKKAMEKFVERPFYYAEKIIDSRLGEYRFRVGDYRIIFDKKGSDIIILRVGHRREIYR